MRWTMGLLGRRIRLTPRHRRRCRKPECRASADSWRQLAAGASLTIPGVKAGGYGVSCPVRRRWPKCRNLSNHHRRDCTTAITIKRVTLESAGPSAPHRHHNPHRLAGHHTALYPSAPQYRSQEDLARPPCQRVGPARPVQHMKRRGSIEGEVGRREGASLSIGGAMAGSPEGPAGAGEMKAPNNARVEAGPGLGANGGARWEGMPVREARPRAAGASNRSRGCPRGPEPHEEPAPMGEAPDKSFIGPVWPDQLGTARGAGPRGGPIQAPATRGWRAGRAPGGTSRGRA